MGGLQKCCPYAFVHRAKYGFELYSLLIFTSGVKCASAIFLNAWEKRTEIAETVLTYELKSRLFNRRKAEFLISNVEMPMQFRIRIIQR